ncbi:MAG: class IV adenylate cyclase [Candidatus Berkelbacteria bacterium]|nr:class IV adenylate cyclase [Candidatus Berkelbacteria bacterium]MCR4307565.1 class IV adenylate cyclase [Candidatus Berkelbacteria bacterium]
MNEIEVKARVTNPGLLFARLGSLGIKLSEPTYQHDLIFSPKDLEEITIFKPDTNFLRIRKENNQAVLALKRSGVNELAVQTEETAVVDPDALTRILEALEYKLSVEVKKQRQKADYHGIEICVDEVEDLGTFIELEELSVTDNNPEETQNKLFKFLQRLGVTEADRVTQGYDTLVALKFGVRR